jgi:hypothetical protein
MVRNWRKLTNISFDLSGGDYELVTNESFSGPGIVQIDGTSLVGTSVEVLCAAHRDVTAITDFVSAGTSTVADGTGIVGSFIDESVIGANFAIRISGTSGTVNAIYWSDRV